MTDVILINPAYRRLIYAKAKIKAGVPINPVLNLAMLASLPLEKGFKIKILDMNVLEDPDYCLKHAIREEKPRFAGITFTTPLFSEAKRIAGIVKDLGLNTTLVAGGPHATTFPEELLNESEFDIVAIGEADSVIKELLESPLDDVKGIVFKKDGKIIRTPQREVMENLDNLPFPAWGLYDLRKYHKPSLSCLKSPPGYLETSRGCPWGCVFCNKNIQGRRFRPKSAKRVVDEIEQMLSSGFREINFLDDTFSTDLSRAKLICEEIIRRGLKFPWHPLNGMRVDRLDRELLSLMKRSGCYKASFGIESGNGQVLRNINKGITINQVERAVKWAKDTGLETFGYFMLGLPGETERTLQDTINFAKKLKLDIAKFNITIPLPGTEIFDAWEKQGQIKTRDWTKYNFYSPYNIIYDHPTLSHDILKRYYRKAYLSFYFSFSFLVRRLMVGIKRKTILRDIKLFFQTNWFN